MNININIYINYIHIGLIAFTKDDIFGTKKILSAALREGKKFMDLFLSTKSSILVDAMFKYEVYLKQYLSFIYIYIYIYLYIYIYIYIYTR
jgi:hypothetical protein